MKGRELLWILFVLSMTAGCRKEESAVPASPELKSCFVEYLYYPDEITMGTVQQIGFPAGPALSLKFTYIRENGHPVRTLGGFGSVPLGTGGIRWLFSNDAYDSLVDRGDSVSLYAKCVYEGGVTWESTLNPVVFVTGTDGRLLRIRRKDSFSGGSYNLVYHFSGNTITEWEEAKYLNRTYYLENGNLVRVVRERWMPDSVAGFRREYLFSDFDDKPNPFKGRYYIRGAFFRAFSDHNYQRISINDFSWMADSGWVQNARSEYTMPLTYTSSGYPAFGDY